MSAVTPEGIANANKVMQSGKMNRYQTSANSDDDDAFLLQCERELCKYFGLKYCLGLNSGGSALMLAMKTSGFPDGSKVLTNCFTFNAVPASISHANMVPTFVDCDDRYVIDFSFVGELRSEPFCNKLTLF